MQQGITIMGDGKISRSIFLTDGHDQSQWRNKSREGEHFSGPHSWLHGSSSRMQDTMHTGKDYVAIATNHPIAAPYKSLDRG